MGEGIVVVENQRPFCIFERIFILVDIDLGPGCGEVNRGVVRICLDGILVSGNCLRKLGVLKKCIRFADKRFGVARRGSCGDKLGRRGRNNNLVHIQRSTNEN